MRPWLELARISNLPTVWTNVTAGWLLAGGMLADARLAGLLLTGSLLYTGGMILNDAADVKFDRTHRPERPIPGGRVSVRSAWAAGMVMLLAGWCLAVFWLKAGLGITTALVVAIIFYDLYHKPWPGAVWIMGACRTLLVLMAGSTACGDACRDDKGVLLHALALGAYVVGISKVARMETRGSPSSLLAGVLAKTLLFAPGFTAAAWMMEAPGWRRLAILGDLTPMVPAVLILVFAALVAHASRLMRREGSLIGSAVGILLAGITVVDALAVLRVSAPLAFSFAILMPLLRLWQRKIAAT